MICRTCRGTGRAKPSPVDSFATFVGITLGIDIPSEKIDKMCPDCYGGGKVINKEVHGMKTGRFSGRKLNRGKG